LADKQGKREQDQIWEDASNDEEQTECIDARTAIDDVVIVRALEGLDGKVRDKRPIHRQTL
jgi:hypothetical protein